jgi:hypothetical protein
MTSRRNLIAGLGSALLLAGCGRVRESRFNPFNWFGRSREENIGSVAPVVDRRDPRPLVDQVTSLVIEPTSTGAIVRATGLPPMQGWHSAALVAETDEPVNGVMVYSFRAVPPDAPTRVSTPQSRELSVARRLSAATLARTQTVRVVAARNARVARR